jgi:hypothetical protein
MDWTRSLQEGERLGAAPEVARTHLEIGHRLAAPNTARRQVAGLDADEHRARARAILTALGMDWDLVRLQPHTARAA